MTEKRFTYMEQLNGFCDVYDDGKVLSCMRLEYVEKTVNLLNELHEEVLYWKQVASQRNNEMIRMINKDSTNNENERFRVSDGVLYEYNSLIDAWHTVDMEKLCIMLNKIDVMFYEFFEDMWLK